MNLSNPQIRLLKRLSVQRLNTLSLSEKESRDVSFLGQNGFIKYVSEADDISCKTGRCFVEIQPKGEAELDEYVRQRRRWYIPVAISILALIISILALYKSSQPLDIHLDISKATIQMNIDTT